MKKTSPNVLFCVLCFVFVQCTGWASVHFDFVLSDKEPSPEIFDSKRWSLVVIPDTQSYVKPYGRRSGHDHIINDMFQWVVDHTEVRNIRGVVHVGDMTASNQKEEWESIRSTYRLLDGVVPYFVCEGNHDRGDKVRLEKKKGDKKTRTRMNEHFKLEDNPENKKIFKGSFEPERLENAYYELNEGGQMFVVLALEFLPRSAVLHWADKVIRQYPKHRVIITIHKYMDEQSRLASSDGLPIPDEKAVQALALKHPNVEFIFCGHCAAVVEYSALSPELVEKVKRNSKKKKDDVFGWDKDIATSHRTDEREHGVALHQILFNSQWIPNGGDGWMLLVSFGSDHKAVQVKTFSPFLKKWRIGPEYTYKLERTSLPPVSNSHTGDL